MQTHFSESDIDIIRGKSMVNACTQAEINTLTFYLGKLEALLDEADMEDFFGTEGWRERIFTE